MLKALKQLVAGRRFGAKFAKRSGFTLIESLAVIAIIGILLALGGYVFTQAQAQARDTVRKSDLDQIAQAFNARFLDKTCTNQAAVGYYPGEGLEQVSGSNSWIKVSALKNYTDPAPYDCNPFTSYLPTIPDDSRSTDAANPYYYYFNLSTVEKSGTQTLAALAKHYRLTTALEHQFTTGSADQLECVRLSHVWINSFGGQPYDCDQHVIVSAKPKVLVSASITCAVDPLTGQSIPNNPPGCTPGTGGTGGTGGGGDLNGNCAQLPDGSYNPPGCNNTGNNGVGNNGTNGTNNNGNNGNNPPGPYNYYVGQ